MVVAYVVEMLVAAEVDTCVEMESVFLSVHDAMQTIKLKGVSLPSVSVFSVQTKSSHSRTSKYTPYADYYKTKGNHPSTSKYTLDADYSMTKVTILAPVNILWMQTTIGLKVTNPSTSQYTFCANYQTKKVHSLSYVCILSMQTIRRNVAYHW